MTPAHSTPRLTLLLLASAGAVCLVYWPTLWFGFRYDDYHVVRPWSAPELAQVLTGTWDPTGIETRFYRPLTAWWYALRFSLFGVNAVAQHAVSLAGVAVCAFMTGVFAWRETRRSDTAILAAALYAVYPAFVYSQSVWLTNQMHLWASAVVLSALLVWQRARSTGSTPLWLCVIALQVVAFGFKEDTIMLLPALLVASILRSLCFGDVRRPHPAIIVTAALVLLALTYGRYVALDRQLGGYGLPRFDRGRANLARAFDVFLQRPADRPWQGVAGWFSVGCATAAIAAALVRRYGPGLYLMTAGAVIGLAFNLPFYLVTKAEQYHLVGLGCVLLIAGAMDCLLAAGRSPAVQRSIAAGLAAGTLSFVPVTTDVVTDFAPCSPITLATDEIVLGWDVVPSEIRDWLRAKPAACAAGTAAALSESVRTITWAHGPEIDETGAPAQWTSGRAVLLLPLASSRLDLTVRSPVASPGDPTTVVVEGDCTPYTWHLTNTGWHSQTIRLRPTWLARLRGMTRLTLRISPVFVPAERFRNDDRRVLGVLMRAPSPAR